jgi:hypothetical protein
MESINSIFIRNTVKDDDQYFSDDDNPSCSLDYLDKAKNGFYYKNDTVT